MLILIIYGKKILSIENDGIFKFFYCFSVFAGDFTTKLFTPVKKYPTLFGRRIKTYIIGLRKPRPATAEKD